MGIGTQRRGSLFVLEWSGTYTVEEAQRSLDAIMALPDLPPDARLLLDLRRSESLLRRSVPDLRAITAHFIRHAPRLGNRIGLLVEGTLRYGLMRMASAWVDFSGVEARVSRDEQELVAWLAAPPAERTEAAPR